MPILIQKHPPVESATRTLQRSMVVFIQNISLPPVLVARKPFKNLMKDYKPA